MVVDQDVSSQLFLLSVIMDPTLWKHLVNVILFFKVSMVKELYRSNKPVSKTIV